MMSTLARHVHVIWVKVTTTSLLRVWGLARESTKEILALHAGLAPACSLSYCILSRRQATPSKGRESEQGCLCLRIQRRDAQALCLRIQRDAQACEGMET